MKRLLGLEFLLTLESSDPKHNHECFWFVHERVETDKCLLPIFTKRFTS